MSWQGLDDYADAEADDVKLESNAPRCCGGLCIRRHGRLYGCARGIDGGLCVLLTIAAAALGLSMVGSAFISSYAIEQLHQSLIIDGPDAPLYASFASNADSPATYYDVRVFDLENPEDVLYSGAKPSVVEVGPYAYEEKWERFDIAFSADGNEVTFYTWTQFMWREEENAQRGLTQDDLVTVPSTVMAGLVWLLQSSAPSVESLVDSLLEQASADACGADPAADPHAAELCTLLADVQAYIDSNDVWRIVLKVLACKTPTESGDLSSLLVPFVRRTVHDLWYGYDDDPVLVLIGETLGEVGALLAALNHTAAAAAVDELAESWSTHVPGVATNHTSEAQVRAAGSTDTLYTGKDDLSRINTYKLWQNMSTVMVCALPPCPKFQADWTAAEAAAAGYDPAWGSDDANRIVGGDATSFPPGVTADTLEQYVDDIYRTAVTKYGGDYSLNDVPVRRYGLDVEDFDNVTLDPSNAEYYQFGPCGLGNMTSVLGAPVFASKPHFLNSSETLVNAIDGLKPDVELHDTYIDVEPWTGSTIRAHKRLQLSVMFEDWSLPAASAARLGELGSALRLAAKAKCVGRNTPDWCDLLPGNVPALNWTCVTEPLNWTLAQPTTFVPYGWADENGEADSDETDAIKELVLGPQDLAISCNLWGAAVAAFTATLLLIGIGVRRMQAPPPEQASRIGTLGDSLID